MFIILHVRKKTHYLGSRLGRNHRMPMLKQAHVRHHAYGHILERSHDDFCLTLYLDNLGLFPHTQNDEHVWHLSSSIREQAELLPIRFW